MATGPRSRLAIKSPNGERCDGRSAVVALLGGTEPREFTDPGAGAGFTNDENDPHGEPADDARVIVDAPSQVVLHLPQ